MRDKLNGGRGILTVWVSLQPPPPPPPGPAVIAFNVQTINRFGFFPSMGKAYLLSSCSPRAEYSFVRLTAQNGQLMFS